MIHNEITEEAAAEGRNDLKGEVTEEHHYHGQCFVSITFL